MVGGRDLTFEGLDEVMPDVDRLLDGHATVGRWTLGQILRHLSTTIRLTIPADGTPPRPTRTPPPSPRGSLIRRRFFAAGRFPAGVEIPLPVLDPPPGLDDRAEAASLGEAIEGLGRAEGAFPAHPMLGPLSKAEWTSFHRMHCAHHLAFAVPTASGPSAVDAGAGPVVEGEPS